MLSQSDFFQSAQAFSCQRPATWRDVMNVRSDNLLRGADSGGVSSYASDEHLRRRTERMNASVPYSPPQQQQVSSQDHLRIGSRVAVPDEEGYYYGKDESDDEATPISSTRAQAAPVAAATSSRGHHGSPHGSSDVRWVRREPAAASASRGANTTHRGSQKYSAPGVMTPRANNKAPDTASYVAREITPPLRPPSSLREIPRPY